MIKLDIPSYFSQHDGDNGGYKGTCVETCFKMIDRYLTGREISIKDIVDHGDGDGSMTSVAGAKKAAKWLGFGVESYTHINTVDIRNWLNSGRLFVAVVQYGLIPDKYKQDKGYHGGHAILITGIEDNDSIRYADPDFWGDKRNQGWMNNSKWISWKDLESAWRTLDYLGFVSLKSKKPVTSPAENQLKECSKNLEECKTNLANRNNTVKVLNKKLTEAEKMIKDKDAIIKKLRKANIELQKRYNFLLEENRLLKNTVEVTTEKESKLKNLLNKALGIFKRA